MSASPLRFGIVGAGRITNNFFVPSMAKIPGIELAAVGSQDVKRAQAQNPARAYDNYDAVLEDPNVDVVYVATHNGAHYEHTMKALKNGKHVLCEKPFALNAQQSEEMVNAAQASGLQLMEAFMYRFHPQIAKAQELVNTGVIGDLRTVEASFSFNLTYPNDVRLVPEWGGGCIFDIGCYCVNFCRTFLGNEPREIRAAGWWDPRHNVDMSVHGVLDYGGGQHGVISCAFDNGFRNHTVLSGTKGTILMNRTFISWELPPQLKLEVDNKVEVFEFEPVDVYELEIRDFVAAIRGEKKPLLPIDEGLANARILDELRRVSQS